MRAGENAVQCGSQPKLSELSSARSATVDENTYRIAMPPGSSSAAVGAGGTHAGSLPLRLRQRRLVDTEYMRTYTVYMNVTLSIDEQLVARARKKAAALGKSLNQLIRDYLQRLAGGDDPERSIQEFKRLSGRGHSRGWRFDRDEIHERS
jgi:hypothetical protein